MLLAVKTDRIVRASAIQLERMHRHREFDAATVAALWPNASARQSAFYQGKKRYKGLPCKKHGDCMRYVVSANCQICGDGASKRFKQQNPEHHRAYMVEWNRRNKEYVSLKNKAYSELNAESIRQYQRNYYRNVRRPIQAMTEV